MKPFPNREPVLPVPLMLLFCVALAFLTIAAGTAWADPSVQDLRDMITRNEKRLSDIERKVEYHKARLQESTQKEQNVLQELKRLTDEIALAEQRLSLLELKQEKTRKRLAELQKEIADTEERIASIRTLLGERIIALYKHGDDMGELSLLLASQNAQDALKTTYYLNRMVRQDEELFNESIEHKHRLDAARSELVKQQKLLARQRAAEEKKKEEFVAIRNKRNTFLEQLRSRREEHKSTVQELRRLEEQVERQIHQLLVRKRQALERKRREEAKKAMERGERPRPVLKKPSGPLAWPVRGEVTSPFGMRQHPVFGTRMRHTGVDIDADQGDPVRAAATGEVLYAGWLRGYGQIVILEHGGKLSTVYAHLSSIRVREGQRVSQGTVLGQVGSTGVSTGPHLHFEVRKDGDATDPMRYLGR
ncbi:MAG: peptidoglycan DD-metalloendopeptidase family protein [Synergistales bacterium]|nr:peptidoglycan DD-metalloendopeptidase family protein [Synergistales bacterium]